MENTKNIYNNPHLYSQKEVGFAFLFLNRCNRSGILYAGPIGGKKQDGKCKIDCRFNKQRIISLISKIGSLKDSIEVYNLDASSLIDRFNNIENSFWFIDPPYFVKGSQLYKNSFRYIDHKSLATKIDKCLYKQKWILTYDNHELIINLYSGYKHRLVPLSYSVGAKKREFELLFYNNIVVPNG